MEPTTALSAIGGAANEISKSGLTEKLLGPTAEYLGQHLRDMVERRLTNTGKIFAVAERRLGSRINNEGSVHPKVLKEILDDGSYAEDEMSAEYFGGILASSRSGVSRDDRGAYFCSMVARLNTYQLRAHYIIYSTFKAKYIDPEYNLSSNQDLHQLFCFVPWDSFMQAMEFTEEENSNTIMSNVFFGLHRETLVGSFAFGEEPKLYPMKVSPGKGLIVSPTTQGAELFMWAHGVGDVPSAYFFHPGVSLTAGIVLTNTEGAYVTDSNTERTKEIAEQ